MCELHNTIEIAGIPTGVTPDELQMVGMVVLGVILLAAVLIINYRVGLLREEHFGGDE